MAARFFLDTNILIYSFDPDEPSKRAISRKLVDRALSGNGLISYQVVQECLHLMLRKFKKRLQPDDAQLLLMNILFPLCRVMPSEALYSEAISIGEHTGWTFYDSLIVSAAISANCDVLFTEDLQDGRTYRGLKICNPFA